MDFQPIGEPGIPETELAKPDLTAQVVSAFGVSAPGFEPIGRDLCCDLSEVTTAPDRKRLQSLNLDTQAGAQSPIRKYLKQAEKAPLPSLVTCELSDGSDTINTRQVAYRQSNRVRSREKAPAGTGNWKFFGASVNQDLKADNVVEKIDSGKLWVVNSRRRNGLIVLREFHAEFAGPGAAVGGSLDEDIVKVIPIGNLSLLAPDSHEEHQNAIKIRLQWIRLTQNFTDQPAPNDRARMILEQFKTYFDQATVDLVPDEAFAMLVGVLPQTIRRVRSGFVW